MIKKSLAIYYGHPESHGSILSAIHSIAERSCKVDIIFRNFFETKWKFPDNVNAIADGKYVPLNIVMKKK